MRSIHLETDLPTDADRVWSAMLSPVTFLYVCRGLFGLPALAGRAEPLREGERGTGRLWVFHVVPAHRHTIEVRNVDSGTRTVRTHEHGGMLRSWNHTLHVEPVGEHRCRYSDRVDIDAGAATRVVAIVATGIFRYRQRRWRRLVRRHLLPEGPAFRT
ncbi:MAG: hypothetical protein GXY65_10855 [Rhodococcus sp.]|uniref:hypothetical protein n=1 Tax=Rhodococcus sp. TaxID=1831 RepID=UPI0016BBE51E|nr:hypothetical protein [Rhodococcus sp. (in: high G+C Gram-positive bacteria)]NLV79817.1 hypothetical protein [Rhodococcus sp. (in: high G+C Gram-positive bacteria)]